MKTGTARDQFEQRFDDEHADMKLTGGPWGRNEWEISCARCCGGPSNQISLDGIYYWLCEYCLALFQGDE